MVPNFLAHPTFSWDGKGKRFHEALNHDFLNASERNCQFYGREVPDWRFAQGEGKKEVTEEDIEKNVNQLEYDNEFCSRCEERFGVLESAYSKFYHMIRIHNMIIDITRKYGYFEKYQTRLYRRKISQIHWYFTLIDDEDDKAFYYQKMKEDYKKCDDEYKSGEAFYKLPRRLQNFFNFAIEYESHEEYRLKTENYDLFYSNYDLSKENRKLKREISSLKDLNRNLLNSKSWKLTEPLRKLKRKGESKNG